MKYIIITGGVISGLGKGLTSSSIGALLRAQGFNVTAIKIDPYLNIDAGTFSPYEHGETFVLDDGSEVDLDLGNYERFMDIKLTREHNITTGKVYMSVISQERSGNYLGQTVQVIPHITDEIIRKIETVAENAPIYNAEAPKICLIELGGVVGDIESMPFVEALRQLIMKLKNEDNCLIHLSLVITTNNKEQKSKPTQMNVRTLNSLGLLPDIIMCRNEEPLFESTKSKISLFCRVKTSHVISLHDCKSIYQVPALLYQQSVLEIIMSKLNLKPEASRSSSFFNDIKKWDQLGEVLTSSEKCIKIGLVGKYTKLQDSYHSVIKALEHSSASLFSRLNVQFIDSEKVENANADADVWKIIKSCDGILVPGGFGNRGIEGMIQTIHYARTNDVPFLGICLGMQCAVIEVCRNVLGIKNANSEEWGEEGYEPVIIEMPEHNPSDLKGGTMRLGLKTSIFKNFKCKSYSFYGNCKEITERHRHRFEVNPNIVKKIEEKSGLEFVATDQTGKRMEICEFHANKFHVAVQFHPEFLSRPFKPSPVYLAFVDACSKNDRIN